MALNSVQRAAWLSKDTHRVVLMDLEYHDGTSLQMLRVSNYPYMMPIGDSTVDPLDGSTVLTNLVYEDIIRNVPNISSDISNPASSASIDILNTGEYDNLLDYALKGHAVNLYIGDKKNSTF